MNEISELTKLIVDFREKRDWAQFHNGKDLAMCLSIESSELLEAFLWKKEGEPINMEKLKDELADVFYSALLLANTYQLDVKDLILRKLKINEEKYPVEKVKGSSKKYNEY